MENYLGSQVVASAVGRALFGSRNRQPAPAQALPEPLIDDVELHAYLLLAYAHFVAEHLPAKQRTRFRAALAATRTDLTERLGLTDAREPPDPARLRTLSKSSALMPLLGVATTNPIAPYQVHITAAARREALHDLAVWIGLYSGYGRSLQWALTRARIAIAPTWADRARLWPPRPGDPSRLDPVELTAIRLVAAELVRQREGLDPDPEVYPILTHAESEILRDQARLAPYSDRRAQALRTLNRQQGALARAIRALEKRRLNPAAPTEGEDEPSGGS